LIEFCAPRRGQKTLPGHGAFERTRTRQESFCM
jgi:hypothetical protein